MNRPVPADISHEIDQLERRIQVRRHRLARHVEELQDSAHSRARPLAIAGVVVVGIALVVWLRAQRRPVGRPVYSRRAATSTGIVAIVIGLVQIALRLASNPLVRAGWNAYRRPRRVPPA